MADYRTLKAGYSEAGYAAADGKFYSVDTATGEATLLITLPYALPDELGTAGQVLTVNAEADGLEWTTPV